MHDFLLAFIGGTLLGVSAVGYLYINGKVAGISGLVGQLFYFKGLTQRPAFWFLSGLVIVPFIYGLYVQPSIELHATTIQMLVAGLLVGFGSRLGSGCTSGHGICGISRVSKRSLIATAVFMIMAGLTVYFIRHVLGEVL